ncbi:hypothetical protein GF340_06260 [Candidatus Peregrinibacteria bacterium]|nr:hypothetical protein [Candidatus Peregrinibacteria bacterium]
MEELPRKLAVAPPEVRGRAARMKILLKTKGEKGGKAKIPPPDPLLFAFPPQRVAFFVAVDLFSYRLTVLIELHKLFL